MPTSQTKPSTPKLSDLAQRVVAPKRVVSTGWPAVQTKCGELGIHFRPWQPDVGRLILAKRGDGKYAATIGGTGLSIPRQVGKTFLVGAIVFALCLLRPNLTVIWTAHRLRTADETFGKMQAFAKRRRIAPHVAKIVLGSGEEEIIFRNGSRILFGARERGFGRGFDEVDVLIFDEGQILSDNALDDMIPATNQSREATGALLLFMGTPPKPKDPSEVWDRMRSEALSGEDDDTGWVEFGADPDFEPTPLPTPLSKADWAQVAKANPSFPTDTSREAILRMRKKLGPESFLREGLGIYVKAKKASPSILPTWNDCAVRPPPGRALPDRPRVKAIGIAVSLDKDWASIAASGEWDNGTPHIGATDRRPGTDWIVAEVKRIMRTHGCGALVDEKCPDAALVKSLRDAGTTVVNLGQVIEACSDLESRVATLTLTHMHDDELDTAVAVATWRYVGDRRVIGRKSGDASMLEAAALALRGVLHPAAVPAAAFA